MSSSVQDDAHKLAKISPGRNLSIVAVSGSLIFAIFLFLLQTLPYLSYRWVTDESWFAGTGYSIFLHHGIANPAFASNYLVSRFDAHPPGAALVIAGAFHLFGVSPISSRLGSIFAGVMLVLLTYLLGRKLVGRHGALIAVFLVATDNFVVITSRTARPEALTAMAVLASLLAMKQFGENGKTLWAFASGLLMAVATMFHVTVAGFVVSLGILAFVLNRKRGGSSLRGGIAFGCAYLLGLVPFAIWILTAPLGRAGFAEEYLKRAAGGSPLQRLLLEGHRYSDLFGLNLIPGLESIPVRLPIPLLVLAASLLLWKMRRQWFYVEMLLLVPTLLWLAYVPDKMSRYFVIIAPVLALTIGAAVSLTSEKRGLQTCLIAISCLVIVAQMSANLFLLRKARLADYNKVAAELRSTIPPGETTYGTITFWMALHDRPYISYERTDPWMAANQYHARYFIAGDRVQVNGLLGDEAFYVQLRQRMDEVIAQSKLVAEIPDPYYGDLKIYRLN